MLYTEKTETEGKFAKIIFPKVSFKTRTYNQLIKQSKSISKLCGDIKEFRVQSAQRFSCGQKISIDYSTHAIRVCVCEKFSQKV
jgi:hypothetical protein